MSFHFTSASATHIGHVRSHNEDAYLDQGECGLWVVADGMGGHDAGDVASKMIVDTLAVVPQVTVDVISIDDVEEALHTVNRQLIELGKANNRINGSTAVVMLASQTTCEFMWAGDSRLYRLRGDHFQQLTRDHSQAEIYVELGMLTREEASTHSSSNLLTRAVGTDKDLKLERGQSDIQAGDRFLLSSDGLDKHVSFEQIRDVVQTESLQDAVDTLIQIALDNGGSDNITVTLIEAQQD